MTRRGLIASGLAAGLLVGCSAVVKPTGTVVEQTHLEPDAIVAADGARLPLRSWLPADGAPRAVILAIHGFNDYSKAFDGAGKYLSQHGIAVYAYDQRGFGAAPNPGFWAGEGTMINDLDNAAALIRARHPGTPFYLLGESMGGAEVMIAMTRATAPAVNGVILCAPAVWDQSHMNVAERVAVWFGRNVVPWMKLSGSSLKITPCDNDKVLDDLWRDPLVIKDTRADAIVGLTDMMNDAQYSAGKLRVPVLFLYGEHDELVPPAPTYKAMDTLPGDPVLAMYGHGYHMLLRDLDADVVLGDIAAWIAQPAAPLPSGADGRARTVLAAAHDARKTG